MAFAFEGSSNIDQQTVQFTLYLSALSEAVGVPALSTLEGNSTPGSSPVSNIIPPPLEDIQTARKILMSLEIKLPPSSAYPKISCKTRTCLERGQSTGSKLLATIAREPSIILSLLALILLTESILHL